MLEIISEISMVEMLQTLAPILFLFGTLVGIVVVLAVLALIFRAEARAEAKAAVKSFARSVKTVTQFLF